MTLDEARRVTVKRHLAEPAITWTVRTPSSPPVGEQRKAAGMRKWATRLLPGVDARSSSLPVPD